MVSTSQPNNAPLVLQNPSGRSLGLVNTDIRSAVDVHLGDGQKVLVSCVLDLFAGLPSLAKLRLWKDDAEFHDPLVLARGRAQYEAQWYGLKAAFSRIERVDHEVTSAGNPIEMSLVNKYVVKGLGKETTVRSKVLIYTDGNEREPQQQSRNAGVQEDVARGLRITKVEDKWDGKLPESGIANAFRRLNAMTVPKLVSVPRSDEDEGKKGN